MLSRLLEFVETSNFTTSCSNKSQVRWESLSLCIAGLLRNLTVEEFRKSVAKVMTKHQVPCFFDSRCIIIITK